MMKCVLLLVVLCPSVVCAATIGPNDGRLWELRGNLGFYSDHQTAAASDTGWVWATKADWLASGLEGLELSDPTKDLFEGSCASDASQSSCFAFLSDPLSGFDAMIVKSLSDESDSLGSYFTEDGFPGYLALYRVAYQEVAPVPLPAAAWLFISAIGGLVGLRKYQAS